MQSPAALAVIYRQILFVSRFHGGRTNTLIASYIPRCTKPARLPARGDPKSDLPVLCSNLPYSFLPKPTVPRPNTLPSPALQERPSLVDRAGVSGRVICNSWGTHPGPPLVRTRVSRCIICNSKEYQEYEVADRIRSEKGNRGSDETKRGLPTCGLKQRREQRKKRATLVKWEKSSDGGAMNSASHTPPGRRGL